MMKLRIAGAGWVWCFLLAVVAAGREWTDSTGQHTVEAELLRVDDGAVRLIKPDGKILAVPIEKLSQADRRFVAQWLHDQKGAAEGELAQQAPAPLPDNAVYERTVPSVVIICSVRGERTIGLGSGFVLHPGNRIVTNEHVIRGASVVRVKTKAGDTFDVTRVLVVDEDRDIAVLPVTRKLGAKLGLSLAAARPKVGDTVFALGAPLKLEFTFTKGIVSQLRRDFLGFGSVVQTDVSISPGSSGGPLVDRYGQVVGINTLASRAAAEAQNLNFAVSAEEIATVCKRETPCKLTDLKGFAEYERLAEAERREEERGEPAADREKVMAAWEKLEDGMTPDEVESLLGRRYKVSPFGDNQTIMYWVYEYPPEMFHHNGLVVFSDKKSEGWGVAIRDFQDPTKWKDPKYWGKPGAPLREEDARAELALQRERQRELIDIIIRSRGGAPSRGRLSGVGNGHWIKKNVNRGEFIILEDGSLWAVAPLEKLDASVWMTMSKITVLQSSHGPPGYDYQLVNTDDGKAVHAKYVGKR